MRAVQLLAGDHTELWGVLQLVSSEGRVGMLRLLLDKGGGAFIERRDR